MRTVLEFVDTGREPLARFSYEGCAPVPAVGEPVNLTTGKRVQWCVVSQREATYFQDASQVILVCSKRPSPVALWSAVSWSGASLAMARPALRRRGAGFARPRADQ